MFVWLFALLFFALLTAFFTKMTALTFNFTLKSISLPVRI
ncbi:hypothetical protein PPIS_a4264 [Pseudoalteromonas piscicida]|uniref:Uncharacterized protein n=1 Tax=Pseudoalteromonas piscicida TaxID=43662 RepID=A0ABM6NJ40_PSEO7|nr:hypothetical protein PPIS_a4264 [Pseudoalteromonas piscicida]